VAWRNETCANSGVLCGVGRNSLLHNEHALSLWTTIPTILVKILVTDFCDNCGDNFDDTYFGEVGDFW
jgi:hypothetical protein